MPVLFIFLLKVNIALIIFYMGYYLVLRRLTFYTLNRIYLVTAIIFSTLYPLINIDGFASRHQQLTNPVQAVITSLKVPAENFVKPIIQQPDYWYWLEAIFWAGAVLFALRLLMQLVSLYKMYRRSKPGKIQGHNVRLVDKDISPFSFWQSIYINPDNLNAVDLKSVLQHEQVHIKEWHTIDVLLTEISAIFYWFNPGVWLMKKAVRENIEFITDRKILQKGMDSKAYQYSLLNVSFAATTSTGITNHFNFSTLKKRIKMMNAKRSSNVNLTRYVFLVPAVIVCLFAFSLSKAEIVKKSKVVYKTVTSSVNNLGAIRLNTDVKVANKKSVGRTKFQDTVKKIRTTTLTVAGSHNGVTDTGRKDTYTVVRTRMGDDTLNSYTINGVKVAKGEFEKVAAQDIENIHVVGDADNKKNIAVTLRTLNNRIQANQGSISITGGAGLKNLNDNPNARIQQTQSLTSGSVNNNSQVNAVLITKDGSTIKNFSDRVIVIDGKEASDDDLKKLPAYDIESIYVNLEKKSMIDKYGDKAKNGVIFFTTKKAKK